MSSSPLHIRRATVDDLPALRSLWTAARLRTEAKMPLLAYLFMPLALVAVGCVAKWVVV